jgi:oligopeptide transport system substrate-binding protein
MPILVKNYLLVNMKKLLIFLALVLVAACNTPQKQKSGALRISFEEAPQSLDPRLAHSLNNQNVLRMLFDGLTRIGKDEKVEESVALRVTRSEDGKRYTFHLRDSFWTNHDPVVAEDFVYAWKKVLDPQFPSDLASQFYGIRNAKAVKEGKLSLDAVGVRALDDRTLEVELEHPIPYFLDLVATSPFFPVNRRLDQINPHWSNEPSSFVSNGPFRLKELKEHDHICVEKNESYWDANVVQLSRIEMCMIQGEAALSLFEKKELDWAGSPFSRIPMEAIPSLRKQELLKSKDILGTYFIRINTECFPLQDAQVRKALALAIDRQQIVEHVTQGDQIPATGLVPPSLGLHSTPYFSDGAGGLSLTMFTDALSRMHQERNTLPVLTLMYPANNRSHLIAQALQQQWARTLGVQIKLESIEPKIYYDRLSRSDYQLAAGDWIADFNDPINFLDVFRYKKGCSNATQWENAQYAQLLCASEVVSDPQERLMLLRESEQLLMEEMPIVPVFYYTMLYLQNPSLHNVVFSSMGTVDFKWAYQR